MTNRTYIRGTAEEMRSNPDDPRHGKDYGYCILACRCARCRQAHSDYHRELYARNHPEVVTLAERQKRNREEADEYGRWEAAHRSRDTQPIPPDDPRHGKLSAYKNLGCRCQDCYDAWREYSGSSANRASRRIP